VLLPGDTHIKPIMSITAVLLPFVTYLLTLSCQGSPPAKSDELPGEKCSFKENLAKHLSKDLQTMTEVRVFQMKARSFPWPYACHT
jgi:hypothetical protein